MIEKIIISLTNLRKVLINPMENNQLSIAIEKAILENPWFDRESILYSLESIALWLDEATLREFVSNYTHKQNPKRVAVICAGNIPMVGFHDMLCTLLSGNIFIGKLSSNDSSLLEAIGSILCDYEKELKERIFFTKSKLEYFDAVIATGSNNTFMYFEYYFGKYSNIIRRSRTSIGVLDKKDTDFSGLVLDILTHKGLGCRNISKIFIPMDFDFLPLIKAFESHLSLLEHNKYRNNYEYHKAIYIMNNISFIDTQTNLLVESSELFSPVSVVYYTYYNDISEVIDYINTNTQNIQCVVSNIDRIEGRIEFGKAQSPSINDFADNVDTMDFLCNRI